MTAALALVPAPSTGPRVELRAVPRADLRLVVADRRGSVAPWPYTWAPTCAACGHRIDLGADRPGVHTWARVREVTAEGVELVGTGALDRGCALRRFDTVASRARYVHVHAVADLRREVDAHANRTGERVHVGRHVHAADLDQLDQLDAAADDLDGLTATH